MWMTRARYEELVQAEAQSRALMVQLRQMTELAERERDRADRATDVALLVRSAPPISPQKPVEPELPMFDDQPEELRQMMKELKRDPVGVLLRDGAGDRGTA